MVISLSASAPTTTATAAAVAWTEAIRSRFTFPKDGIHWFRLVLWSPYYLALILVAVNSVFVTYLVVGWFKRWLDFQLGRDEYAFLKMPEPPKPKWQFHFIGHLKAIFKAHPAEAHLAYLREVDCPIYTYRTVLFSNRLFIGDPKAIAYILSSQNSYDFEKPKFVRDFLTNVLGEGILVSEGETHRRARRVLQPAFTLGTIRALTPVFFKYALQMRRNLLDSIDATEGPASRAFMPGQSDICASISSKGKPVVNVAIWLSLCTMDIIGEAGFGHEFHALKGLAKPDLAEDVIRRAFVSVTATAEHPGALDMVLIILARVTGLSMIQKLPTRRSRRIAKQYKLLQEISQQIIAKKKAEVLDEMETMRLQSSSAFSAGRNGGRAAPSSSVPAQTSADTTTTKQMFDDLMNDGVERPRDIIHQMLRANLSKDLPAALKLRDDEMLPQITTLLLAGQETTSTQLTWCLWLLAQPENKLFQTALRQEVRDVFAGRDEIRHDELQTLKLLDHIMLESMRLKSAVPSSIRVPSKDHVLPLSQAYVTRDGKSTFDRLPIKKGQDLFIFIQALNRAPHLWGEDADAFNPSRWENLPDTITSLSPDWSSGHPSQSLWTFLAGPRGCIGRSFAITEFKAILATLIRDLDFDVIPGWEIEPKTDVVLTARVKGQEHLRKQMPLRVSRVPS
ncbi:hypothetical protein A4X09_0g4756 [Tilletia walkeri]|uniref:Cytochrome P450 n=1 Tax=Tilletia walkeri TaxID=117179 RepID=A0A8X7T4Q6_9BASI|nr:hypothetical protein CF326_g4085 [Tilletia indica]KAE8267588.1 hypothetical protein A4X09_0g4756 [Tilletia walkeri]